jgi:predicted dehydrogenase
MDKLRVGIIGCGGIATGKHLPAIRATGLADVVAFCSPRVEKARASAQTYGTPDAFVCTDYRELLARDLDAVYVCTPNSTHAEITVAALTSGKHVMCEKPMALDSAEALQMCETAEKTGKLLTISYQSRFRPDSQYLKAECAAGALGEIYYAKAKARRRRAVPTWGVFLDQAKQGGGPLIDIGTHALDLALWLMDNYTPVTVVGNVYHRLAGEAGAGNTFGAWDPAAFTVEDSAFGFVTMANGATVVVEASWALNTLDVGEAKVELCGTTAGADMFDGLRLNGVKHNRPYVLRPATEPGGVAFYEGSEDTPEVREQRVFLEAVRGERPLVVLPREALVVTRIIDAIYESAREGRQVQL